MTDSQMQPSDSPQKSEQNSSWLQDGIHGFTGLFLGDDKGPKDPQKTDYRTEVEHYAAEALKVVPLFIPTVGRAWSFAAYGGSATLQGLDQVHDGDSGTKQLMDFGLGATKGALTKLSFDVLGKADFTKMNKLVDIGLVPKGLGGAPLALTGKAFSFGLSNRLLDTSLTSDTWLDKAGKFDATKGLGTTVGDMIRPSSLLTDVAVFGASPLLLKGANAAFRGALDRSPLAITIATGYSFGLVSGALAEAQRQYHQDEQFDPGKIALRGLLEGTASGLGASVGGFRANYLAAPIAKAEPTGVQKLGQSQDLPPAEPLSHATKSDLKPEPLRPLPPAPEGASLAELLVVKPTTHIDTYTNQSDPVFNNAKKYSVDAAEPFWQLQDGRILIEKEKADSGKPVYQTWVPPASDERYGSGVLNPDGNKYRQETLDERHGVWRDNQGRPVRSAYERANHFDLPEDSQAKLSVPAQTKDNLHIVAPNVEKDWQAAVRILPTRSGDTFERADVATWQKVPGFKMNGQPTEKEVETKTPGRIYRLLTQDQSVELADLNEARAAKTISDDKYEEGRRNLSALAVQLHVPEELGRVFDALRDLRKVATMSPDMVPQEREAILKARRDLYTSEYRDRFLPEQMGQFFDGLPDRSMMGRVYMLRGDSRHYSNDLFAADARVNEGQTRLFSGVSHADDQISEIVKHEWTHMAEDSDKSLFAAYDAAKKLEPFVSREYGNTDKSEHWAVNLGEMFLDADSERFLTLAHAAPIKSAILAEGLERTLNRTNPELTSSDNQELRRRIDYVKRVIEPIAGAKLNEALASSDPAAIGKAADLALTLSQDESARPLINRLVDSKALAAAIDASNAEQNGAGAPSWKSGITNLLRLELLKAADPDAFKERQPAYDTTLSTTSDTTRKLLRDMENPDSVRAIVAAQSLVKDSNLRPLLNQLFPADDLKWVAVNSTNANRANAAFELITLGENPIVATKAALDLVKSSSLAKGDAAKFLLRDGQGTPMLWGVNELAKLVDQKVPAFTSPEFVSDLSQSIDRSLDNTYSAQKAMDVAYKGALLEHITKVMPEYVDDAMRQRLEHVGNVIKAAPGELLLAIKPSVYIETHYNQAEGALDGAKKYKVYDEQGREFWQLKDGRILYQEEKGDAGTPRYLIWVPPASEDRYSMGLIDPVVVKIQEESGDLHAKEKAAVSLVLDEKHGIYRDASGKRFYDSFDRRNGFDSVDGNVFKPKVDDATKDKLRIVDPNLEKDWQAAVRILPTQSGESFERADINTWLKSPVPKMNGENASKISQGSTPGRIYRILTQEQAAELAELKEKLAAGTISSDEHEQGRQKLGDLAVQLHVPEDWGRKLDALRDLRRVATLSPEMMPDNAEEILKARRDLFNSAYRDRFLPEQFGQFFDALPDRSMVTRTYLLDSDAMFFREGTAMADADLQTREVRLFNRTSQVNDQMRETIKHEWTHVAQAANADLFGAYNAAKKLEPFVPRTYGNENEHEHWAVNLGEMFLDSDSEMFLTLAHAAPVKTVILAEAMQRTLDMAKPEMRSSDEKELRDRIEYVKDVIEPIARTRLNNGLSRSNPAMVARAADLAITLGSKQGTQHFLERLFDVNRLTSALDTPRVDQKDDAHFDWQLEARRLLRLTALRAIDVDAFRARKAEYDNSLATAAAYTRSHLLSPDSAENADAMTLGKILAGHENLRPLFNQLYPASELQRAAMDRQHPDQAKAAFEWMTLDKDTKAASGAALELLNTDNPVRLDAANFLLRDGNRRNTLTAVDHLVNLVDSKVPAFTSPEFVQDLSKNIDQSLDNVFSSFRATQIIYKGALLERILTVKPDLLDEQMKSRLAHINNVKLMTRESIASTFAPNVPESDRSKMLIDLQGLTRFKDPGLHRLAKELIPRMVLEHVIRQGLTTDPKVLRIAHRLYGREMQPLMTQLATSNGPFRGAAVEELLPTRNAALLKQVAQSVDQFSSWGNEVTRMRLLEDLRRQIHRTEMQSTLTAGEADRMEIRTAMMEKLMAPLRMDLWGEVLDKYHDVAEAARIKLAKLRSGEIAPKPPA